MNKDINCLLVEDNMAYALLIKRGFRANGFENIQHFENGQEILDFLLYHRNSPDLILSKNIILLDINMPKVDGFEVLRRIKGDEMLRSIPVIMHTTTDNGEAIDRCNKIGCDGFIVKSPYICEVLKKLEGFLQIETVS
jgi:CheY-like chemotaxis protein